MAHVIEARGIRTLVVGTALDIMSKVRPPRVVFLDHPVGRTFGPPHDRVRNEAVLIAALNELPKFTTPMRSATFTVNGSPTAAAHGKPSSEQKLRAR